MGSELGNVTGPIPKKGDGRGRHGGWGDLGRANLCVRNGAGKVGTGQMTPFLIQRC